jgi:hypothetical protein
MLFGVFFSLVLADDPFIAQVHFIPHQNNLTAVGAIPIDN